MEETLTKTEALQHNQLIAIKTLLQKSFATMVPPIDDKKGKYEKVSQDPELKASLVHTPDIELAPAVPMVEIVAPATLMGGYELGVEIGGRQMTVIVPPGGVAKGQKFNVPMPAASDKSEVTEKGSVPVGAWRDGLCDCCHYGLFHSSLWLSFCFPLCAIGQVITRLQLDWLGLPTENRSSRATAFTTLFTLAAIYFIVEFTLGFVIGGIREAHPGSIKYNSQHQMIYEENDTVIMLRLISKWIRIFFGLFSIFIIYNVR